MTIVTDHPAGSVDITVDPTRTVTVTVTVRRRAGRAAGPTTDTHDSVATFTAHDGRVVGTVHRGNIAREAIDAADLLTAERGSMPVAGPDLPGWAGLATDDGRTVAQVLAPALLELARQAQHPHVGALDGASLPELYDLLRWPALAGARRDLGFVPDLADTAADPLAAGLVRAQLSDAMCVWFAGGSRALRRTAVELLSAHGRTSPRPVRRLLEMTAALHGLLDDSQLADLLASADPGTVDPAAEVPHKARQLLGQLPGGRLRRLVTDGFSAGRQLTDTLNDLIAVAGHDVDAAEAVLASHRRWRTLDGLADQVATIAAQIRQTPAPAPTDACGADGGQGAATVTSLPYPDPVVALAGRTIADGQRTLTVTVPPDADQLIVWGQQLHNCVGDYRDQVADGHRYVLALCDSGQAHWAVDLTTDGRLTQFRGVNNRQAPPELTTRLRDLLVETGALVG